MDNIIDCVYDGFIYTSSNNEWKPDYYRHFFRDIIHKGKKFGSLSFEFTKTMDKVKFYPGMKCRITFDSVSVHNDSITVRFPILIEVPGKRVIKNGSHIKEEGQQLPIPDSVYPKIRILNTQLWEELNLLLESIHMDVYMILWLKCYLSPLRLKRYYKKNQRLAELQFTYPDKKFLQDILWQYAKLSSPTEAISKKNMPKLISFIKKDKRFTPDKNKITFKGIKQQYHDAGFWVNPGHRFMDEGREYEVTNIWYHLTKNYLLYCTYSYRLVLKHGLSQTEKISDGFFQLFSQNKKTIIRFDKFERQIGIFN